MSMRDANAAGDVHGGFIMKLCDDVAVIAAARHARCRVVTAAVDNLRFRRPVKTSHVVTLKATVNAAWRTSMEVGVHIEAEDVLAGVVHHTLTAYLTLVALDDDGRPTPVPKLESETDEDARRAHQANLRRRLRLAADERLEEVHHLLAERRPAPAHRLAADPSAR